MYICIYVYIHVLYALLHHSSDRNEIFTQQKSRGIKYKKKFEIRHKMSGAERVSERELYIYVCAYVCVYVCMCMCMYVCLCVCLCMY